MIKLKKKNSIFLIDFDKTITDKDTTDELIRSHDENLLDKFHTNFKNQDINIREYLSGLLSSLFISELDYNNQIGINVKIDEYFKEFLKLEYEFRIVSAGTYNNIIYTLEKSGLEIDKEKMYSNELIFKEKNIKVRYPYNKNCGFCGICKKEILLKYKKEYDNVIFVGDGSSDLCASKYADIIFAKKGCKLEKFSKENNMDYIPYSNFKDIMKSIFLI
ncbi:MAG: HAD-IB family phosphatase [Fusobacteriota bacterium]